MQNTGLHSDSKFSQLLDNRRNSDILMHINTENLLLGDLVRGRVGNILDLEEGNDSTNNRANMGGKMFSNKIFTNNSFVPNKSQLMESNYENKLSKHEEDINLLNNCIMLYENNPGEKQIWNLRGYIIMKIETVTKRVLEMRGKNKPETEEDKTSRHFLDHVLNCFNKESALLVIKELEKMKLKKYQEISLINNEYSKFKKSPNFKRGNYNTSS